MLLGRPTAGAVVGAGRQLVRIHTVLGVERRDVVMHRDRQAPGRTRVEQRRELHGVEVVRAGRRRQPLR